MRLENLNLLNFKNYAEVALQFTSRVNVLVGKNGSGKTNLLDSIYYLSFTKSAFSTSDAALVRHDEAFLMVKGNFAINGRHHKVSSSVQAGSRKVFRLDSQDYPKISDHIGRFPVVLIAPDDVELIREGGELRRRFFDGMISQLDRRYLDELMRFNHFIKQRNSLLKMAAERGHVDWLAIEAYDESLIQAGDYLFRKRQAFVAEFLPVFRQYFNFVVSEVEHCDLTYDSELLTTDYRAGLASSRTRDLALQRTTFGIHRDDFVFTLGSRDIKKLGSQGQQKSFVIALKLAQHEILKKHNGFKPILLLDDIFDKLDDHRIGKLLELIRGDLGQLFITDARPDRTSQLLSEINVESQVFYTDNGTITI